MFVFSLIFLVLFCVFLRFAEGFLQLPKGLSTVVFWFVCFQLMYSIAEVPSVSKCYPNFCLGGVNKHSTWTVVSEEKGLFLQVVPPTIS